MPEECLTNFSCPSMGIFSLYFRPVVSSAPLLWVLAGWGLLALIIDPKARARLFFAGTLVTFSILAIIPDFIFFTLTLCWFFPQFRC